MLRDFPHPEKAQNVIDAVGMEVLLHVLKAATPPAAPILVHLAPVVRRKPPVLLRVAWRTCILVEFEEVGFRPHILPYRFTYAEVRCALVLRLGHQHPHKTRGREAVNANLRAPSDTDGQITLEGHA